ncbi:MAG: TonB-dependent receptor domain-containing protein [Fidelibacterota bacterium]
MTRQKQQINNSRSGVFYNLVFITFLIGITTLSQGATTGKIMGTVTDSEGDPLAGVNVVITGTQLGAASRADGFYLILNVSPGLYSLKFSMIGYTELIIDNIDVRSDHTTEVNGALHPTVLEAAEAVTVVAEKPVIEIDRTSTSASVSAQQIEIMPVQTVDDLLNLQAGVVDGHFRGGRSQEVSYLIDGIPVNDVFASNAALLVENSVIQELKVVSGTFNAEYGQAQSGIVEIITREGMDNFGGNFSTTLGDYYSTNTDIFRNIDEINPLAYSEYSLFLNGPLLGRMRYLFNYQLTTDEGHLFGRDYFEPSVLDDSVVFRDTLGFVPMSDYRRESIFGKISFPLTSRSRIAFNMTYQNRNYGIYEHMFSFTPKGNSRIGERNIIGYVSWNFLLSQRTYFNLALSYLWKEYDRFLFDDSLDTRYSTDTRLEDHGNFSFYTGGTDMRYYERSTQTATFKADITSQLNRTVEVSTGTEWQLHQLYLHDLELKRNPETGFEIQVPPPNTADNQEYNRDPLEGAAYLQTKVESKDLIINAGVRLDYFDARGEVVNDLERPQSSERSTSKPYVQWSPRFGLAYPISDKGVMHASYGHFFQVPRFEVLYTNPEFTINPEGGRANVLNFPFGNAELKPQKTVAYEVGIQQQITADVRIEATAYYKDIRNLLGTEIHTIATGENHAGIDYGRYINRDYGQVRGFTLMLEKRLIMGIGASIDYTYQVARGNASDPKAVLIDNQSDPPIESEKQLVFLDWDQTHTLNAQISLQPASKTVVTMVGRYGSGMPYTPSVDKTRAVIENSDRKPQQLIFDLFARKEISFPGVSVKLVLKIYNLFDRLNERNVYGDSGRATYTEELNRPGEVQGWNTKEEFFTRPDWYSPPRQILLGLSVDF